MTPLVLRPRRALLTASVLSGVLLALSVAGWVAMPTQTRDLFTPPQLLTLALFVLVIGLANPEAWVAQQNIDRYHATGKLDAAYLAHPDRFVRRPPRPLPLPSEVWINKPIPGSQTTEEESQ